MLQPVSNYSARVKKSNDPKRHTWLILQANSGQVFLGDEHPRERADVALDHITELYASLARRDPELGSYLVDALESHGVTSKEIEPLEEVRTALGLPPRREVTLD